MWPQQAGQGLDEVLPDDALIEVCLHVPSAVDLTRLATTSRTMWRVASSDVVWKHQWRKERKTESVEAVTLLLELHPNARLGPPFPWKQGKQQQQYSGGPNANPVDGINEWGGSVWMQAFVATGTGGELGHLTF
jgi:hypothetical protein